MMFPASSRCRQLASAKYSYGAKLINIIKHLSWNMCILNSHRSERARVQNEKLSEIVQITNKCILQRRAHQRKWVYDMTSPWKVINLGGKNGRKTAQQEANRSCCHRGKYDSLNRKFMMISLRWKCLYFCAKSLFNMFWIFADPFRPIWPEP